MTDLLENNCFTLSEKDKTILLEIARSSIEIFLNDHDKNFIDPVTVGENLKVRTGAFVTLKKNGSLRGCIGRFTTDLPLYKVVQDMAVASATSDHRFESVCMGEMDQIGIEISVLSPLKKISSIDEIEMGKHGIYLKKGVQSGTFLPQVAQQTGWTKEEFLGHCARDKARIGWEGWKSSEMYVYEAYVFSEPE